MSDKVISEIAKSIIMEEVISEGELYRIRDLSDGSILALATFNPGEVNIPQMSIEVDQAEGDLETEAASSPDADVLNSPDELAGWLKLVGGPLGRFAGAMGEDVESERYFVFDIINGQLTLVFGPADDMGEVSTFLLEQYGTSDLAPASHAGRTLYLADKTEVMVVPEGGISDFFSRME
jgi:hypothetical protein